MLLSKQAFIQLIYKIHWVFHKLFSAVTFPLTAAINVSFLVGSESDKDEVCVLRPLFWMCNASVFIICFLSLLYKYMFPSSVFVLLNVLLSGK